ELAAAARSKRGRARSEISVGRSAHRARARYAGLLRQDSVRARCRGADEGVARVARETATASRRERRRAATSRAVRRRRHRAALCVNQNRGAEEREREPKDDFRFHCFSSGVLRYLSASISWIFASYTL